MTGIPIRGVATGTAAQAYAIAVRRGALRLEFTRPYFVALYAVCKQLGINADVLVAQWDAETGAGTSDYWTRDGNPAGIAAFPDGSNWGLTFTPETAAGAQAAHMGHYLGIAVPEAIRKLDARWDAVAEAGYVGSVTTTDDLGNGRWATDPDYAGLLVQRYEAYWGPYRHAGDTTVATTTPTKQTIAFGNVPKFGYLDLQAEMANKPEGVGWDNLGKRDMLGLVLHRMWGTLNGTRVFFRDPSTQALTDFAVGVEAIDGQANAGVIQQYNDPFGYRSGWASGRVSAPYGDGLLFVRKYGVNAVNKRLTSLEISGYENTPIDDFAWGEVVHFVAYWADQCHIRWDQFPINPATGISFLFWHQEMTIGTGKLCPWNVVMSRTNELIQDVQAMLKTAQTSSVEPTPPVEIPPIVIPPPTYAAAVPITELAMMADRDFAGAKPYRDIVLANGKKLRARVVLDKVKVTTADVFYQQYAVASGKRTKPDPKVGDLVDVVYSITADDGNEYWIDPQWARIAQDKAVLYED